MPARIVINSESVVGDSNQLKQVEAGMKLGINDQINKSTKKAALKLVEGGPSKISTSASCSFNSSNIFARLALNWSTRGCSFAFCFACFSRAATSFFAFSRSL